MTSALQMSLQYHAINEAL